MGAIKEEILQEEREANVFAMELLIPKFLLEKEELLHRDVMDIEDGVLVRVLAEKYQVSEHLMMMRLCSLGYINL